ncbi:hypothetical protein CC78DRAFT_588428 [Lojkania enalia]|uniref:Uncharacterized protein n=1 Tax=Lojkania enalia TaxID=147567 RepID=A0A9P4N0D1_9PLEO|nr:hypothetical protein CC78DRAFT_588428 [Didymosphaeria enalia]
MAFAHALAVGERQAGSQGVHGCESAIHSTPCHSPSAPTGPARRTPTAGHDSILTPRCINHPLQERLMPALRGSAISKGSWRLCRFGSRRRLDSRALSTQFLSMPPSTTPLHVDIICQGPYENSHMQSYYAVNWKTPINLTFCESGDVPGTRPRS